MSPEQISAYKPLKTISNVTAVIFGLLIITMAGPVLMTGALLIEPTLLYGRDSLAGTIESIYVVIGGIESLLRIVCIVVFLIWVYRGFVNLTAISPAVLEFTPGGAVGWWFVPFVNIVRGYQIVRELWTFSAPDAADDDMFPVTPSAPWWMIIWWLTFIFGNILLRVSTMVTESDIKKFGGMELLWGPIFLGGFLHIVSALFLIRIVMGVNSMQEERFAKLVQTPMTATPPPPVFSQDEGNEVV